MNNILEYKGYYTKPQFDADSMSIRGKIEGIKDYIDYEANSTKDIEEAFHLAVDDYLAFCKEVGKSPDKVYKGSFNVRINPELHKTLALTSFETGESLNSLVEKAIQTYIFSLKKGAS